jgi:hypothetical protein
LDPYGTGNDGGGTQTGDGSTSGNTDGEVNDDSEECIGQVCFGFTVGDGSRDSCCITNADCASDRCCTDDIICNFDECDQRFTCRDPI